MGFLKTKDIPADQMDLGIEVILELFTQRRLAEVFDRAWPQVMTSSAGEGQGGELDAAPKEGEVSEEHDLTVSSPHAGLSPNACRILALRGEYLATIEPVIRFLQGKQPTLARQIAGENFLPQASRFDALAELDFAFGNMGHQDKAKHLATLYLEDLSDFIVETLDPHFGFSRYAERLGRSANSFDELHEALQQPLSYIDELTIELLENKLSGRSPSPNEAQAIPSEVWGASGRSPSPNERLTNLSNEGQPKDQKTNRPTLVCLSVPFPGNLFSAFRCAQWLKANHPEITTVMGGGFPNTELRSVNDPRVFDYFDYITLDDGELPLELLWQHSTAPASAANKSKPLLKRTFHLEEGKVLFNNFSLRRDYRMSEIGTPDYAGLPLDRYISVIEIANPMHSLWSDGRWNKLTMAHGCYWGKCTFCDVSLDYIGNYKPVNASLLVDRMEEMIAQTGENGFHFVDEAAPPALMRDLALEIIRRNLRVSWWTNIRFEKSFTADLCRLLQASGCIAVSGGLEVASDRLLALIQKGVTVEQVARVTSAFTDAGIMVHSYLMYGYPTQTVQETIDSLEMVRQLFQAGVIQSGFWHQFALTAHSPVGLDPEAYGIVPHYAEIRFANNDVQFTDSTGIDHSQFSYGLKKSLFNFMHGQCFDYPLEEWFDFEVPLTTISPDYIATALEYQEDLLARDNARVIWVGGEPTLTHNPEGGVVVALYDRRDSDHFNLPSPLAKWLVSTLRVAGEHSRKPGTIGQLRASFEEAFAGSFEDFWYSDEMELVRAYGLLVV